MIVIVTLKKHTVISKIDIKVLEIQLDFKLRWVSHMRNKINRTTKNNANDYEIYIKIYDNDE